MILRIILLASPLDRRIAGQLLGSGYSKEQRVDIGRMHPEFLDRPVHPA